MNTQVYKVQAFAKTPEGGNPAGIMLDADSLTIEEKQQIAKEINFSETAFIQKSKMANFKTRKPLSMQANTLKKPRLEF